jgi:hypothetical protein
VKDSSVYFPRVAVSLLHQNCELKDNPRDSQTMSAVIVLSVEEQRRSPPNFYLGRSFMKMIRSFSFLMAAYACLLGAPAAWAVTNVLFDASQTSTLVVSNINAVTIQSGDDRFTCSADGCWSSGAGTPTGRFFSVFWPDGVQAQASIAGPLLGTGANLTLKRADGKPFDLQAFTGKILLNTAGAGGAFEIMPYSTATTRSTIRFNTIAPATPDRAFLTSRHWLAMILTKFTCGAIFASPGGKPAQSFYRLRYTP